jgi:2-polyprenyl-3-methyl-5-hydroxy-6-metoxy-1,4-benzoquinol methylase
MDPDANALGLTDKALNPLRYGVYSPANPDGVLAKITALAPPDASVLDVGCGTGSVGRHLMDNKNARVTGVEPHAERAAQARSLGLDVHNAAFTPELAVGLGRFDVVLFADVLEHIPAPATFLQLAHSLLHKDGCVIIVVPNAVHWSMRWHILTGHFDYSACGIRDGTHLRWFTRKSIKRLLHATGYSVTHTTYTTGISCNEPPAIPPGAWIIAIYKAVKPLLRLLTSLLPNLLGLQIIIKARPISMGK